MSRELHSLAERFASVEGRVSVLETGSERLANVIGSAVDSADSEVRKSIMEADENAKRYADGAKAVAEEGLQKVSALEAYTDSGLAALRQKESEIEERHRSEVGGVEQKLDAAASMAKGSMERVAALEGRLSSLEGKVDSMSSEVASLASQADQKVEALGNALRSEAQATSEDARGSGEALKSQIGAQAGKIASIEERLGLLDSGGGGTVKKMEEQITEGRAELKDALRFVLRTSA